VPQVGSRYNGRPKDSQSSSSSSLSTKSSTSTIRQLKKAQLAEKKAVAEACRLGGNPTKPVPNHLVSHMLPYFYPDNYEYEEDSTHTDTSVDVPQHLRSHVTTYCYPFAGTLDDENVQEPRPDIVPRHLVSHVTSYCYPFTGTIDDEDCQEPNPADIHRLPHLESHMAPYCQPIDDDGAVIEWPVQVPADESTHPKQRRTNYVPRHLQSHLFDSDDNVKGDGEAERRSAICCDMTRNHANTKDSVFAADSDQPIRRVGGRRAVANCNLFEESKPKQRPMCITIVQRAPEDTKDNIFGSELWTKLYSRRRWEHDTMKTIFCRDDDTPTSDTPPPSPRSRNYEDTAEKLFGNTYGIKEKEAELARRRRPFREDTQMTLFGPPPPPPQRPQSARSFTNTHDNIFGPLPPPQSGRRSLHRENTFDNLFGVTPTRSVASGVNERFTPKNPKILQASSFVAVGN